MTHDTAAPADETIFTWGAPPLKFGAGTLTLSREDERARERLASLRQVAQAVAARLN